MATKTKRETIYDKADRILADPNRVITLSALGDSYWKGLVRGDHGTYEVIAISKDYADEHGIEIGRVACSCPRGKQAKICSHMLCGEEMRAWGEQE